MKKSINHQLSLMFHKKEFSIAFCATMAFCIASFFSAISTCWGMDKFKVLSADSMFVGSAWFPMWPFFQYIFVFLVVVPYSMSYINDIESEIVSVILVRENRKQYFASLMVACFVGNAITILVPFSINLGLCHLAFGREENTIFGAYETWGYYQTLMGTNFAHPTLYQKLPLLKLYLFSSGLYNFAYIVFLSLTAGLLGVFVLCMSMWGIKSRALLFTPLYLLWLVSSVASEYSYSRAVSGDGSFYTNYNFMDYLSANGGVGQDFNYFSIILLVMVMFCMITYLRMIKIDILGMWERRKNDKAGKKKNG